MIKRIASNILSTNILSDFLCFTVILFALVSFLNSALPTYGKYYPIKAAHASDIDRGA